MKRNGWSEQEIDSASQLVREAYFSQTYWSLAKQATELAAVFAGCQFFAGRLPVPVISLFSRSACIVGLGIPLNTYFLYEAIKSYDEAFHDFFIAVEPHRLIESVENLNSKSAGVALAAIFFSRLVFLLAPISKLQPN